MREYGIDSAVTSDEDFECKLLSRSYDVAAITNDIYTKKDAEFLTRAGALSPDRIMGVETGGCPHTAIREDSSINLAAVADMVQRFPGLELVFVESGGDIQPGTRGYHHLCHRCLGR